MPIDRRVPQEPENPLKVFLNSRHSIHFDDIEFQRKFEQNLIRYKLLGGDVGKETVTISPQVSGGGGTSDCYWTLEGSNIVRYGGNVGVGIHPHDNDFEVRGNVLVESIAEQPYIEIRNWSDTEYDPVIHWSLGASPIKKYTMGVDDSDSDAWLLCSGDILTSVVVPADPGTLVIAYNGQLGIPDYKNATTHQINTHLSDNTLALSSHFHLAEGDGDDEAGTHIQDICSDGTYYYITDRANHRIKKHRISDGLFMWAVGGPGSGTGNDEFNTPWGICTDGTYLYIVDRSNLRIKKHLCSTGAYVAKVGSYGTGMNQFLDPYAICTDGVHLYITQNGGWPGRLEKYTCGLIYVGQLDDDGYINSATLVGICTDGLNLYITNANAADGISWFIIYKYTLALTFVERYGKNGAADENAMPYGICTDKTYLYIVDMACANVKKFKLSDYSFVAKTNGVAPDTFYQMLGICANATFSLTNPTPYRAPILKAALDCSYLDAYPLFRARDGFQLMEDGTVGATDYIGLYAPAAITTSYSLTFPGTGPAGASHFAVDAAGAITWGQNVGTTGTPSFVHLHATVAGGTAPLEITSTTVCANLNADLLDGSHAVAFAASAHTHNANEVIVPGGIGTPTYDDMQDFLRMTRSAGRLTGGVVSAHAGPNGTVDISAMEGMIFTTDALGGTYIYFKQAAATAGLALTDLAVNWVYFDWNGGTPRYLATVTRSDIHEYDQFTVGRVWRSGNTVDVLATGHSLYDKDRRSHNRLILKYGSMDRAGGGTLSQHTTALRIQTDAGSWYVANTAYATPAADTFKVIYKTGGSATWVEGAAVTLFSDVFDGAGGNKVYESYQNGNSIGTLSAGRYGVYWVFMSPLGVLFVVMDSVNTGSIATAQASPVPSSLPARCVNWARLVGRVICKKSDAALYSVESSFAYSFTLSAAVDHSSLANRTAVDSHPQGAITGLTTADGPTFDHLHLTTDLPVSEGGTGKSSFTQYAIPYASAGTTIGEIAIGDAGKVLAVNGGATGYEWIAAGGSLALDDLTDVDAASPSDHDIIQYHTGTGWVHGGLPAGAAHDILSSTHGDSTASAVVRGDIIIGSVAAPNTKWTALTVGISGTYLAGGTEPSWVTLNQAAVAGLTTSDSPNFAGLSVGTNDVVRGLLYLYGHASGGVYGGTLVCHTSADHDAAISNYGFMVKEDDLLIGPDTNVDALLLDSNDDLYITAGSLVLPASEYLNLGGTLGSAGYGLRDNSGDIEYKDSGGSWIALNALGGGAMAFADLTDYPADAAGVLTNDGAGALSWAAGGGGTYTLFSPDAFPASPTAQSDHFDNDSFTGWSTFNPGAYTMSVVEADHHMKITRATNAGEDYSGYFKALPSGDFTITAKVYPMKTSCAAGYCGIALALFEDATNNPNTSDFVVHGIRMSGSCTRFIVTNRWTAYNAWGANYAVTSTSDFFGTFYLRIRRSGTTLYFDYSYATGMAWVEAYSVAQPFAPAEFGFLTHNYITNVDSVTWCDWICYEAANNINPPGRVITVATP